MNHVCLTEWGKIFQAEEVKSRKELFWKFYPPSGIKIIGTRVIYLCGILQGFLGTSPVTNNPVVVLP
jgi:hypothetical protein